MKITHICMSGMTDGFNYQENVLSKYHKKLGYDVSVIATQWIWGTDGKLQTTDRTNYVNKDGVKVIRLPMRCGTPVNKLKVFPGLYRAVEQEQPDILFIHNCQFLDICKLAKYAKRHKNVKIFVDNHVDFSNGAHGWLSKNILHKGLWRFCVKKIEPYTTKFYGVLPARVDFLRNMYDLPAEKCELLVMGGDDELVEAAAKPEVRGQLRKQYGIEQNDFLIITGGKIDAYKTQTLLLMEAVQNIHHSKVKLIVFGSVIDALQEKVESLADGKKVQYIGWINANDSYRYFAAADLAVFPGRHSVFWEQVTAQGIPMLCKKWDGTTHVDVGGNVRFLEEDSAELIQREIERLLEHPEEYARMKKVAAGSGMKTFAYSQIARRSVGG